MRFDRFFKTPFNLKQGDLIVAEASAINENGQGTSSPQNTIGAKLRGVP
jgi:hypothetical protein